MARPSRRSRHRRHRCSLSYKNTLIFQSVCTSQSTFGLSGRIESITHRVYLTGVTYVLRCARDSRNRAVSADDVGREHGDGSIGIGVTPRAQELPGLSRFYFLYSCQPGSGHFAFYGLPPMGVFLKTLLAFRVGDADCGGLCARFGGGRGGWAFPLPLSGDLGASAPPVARVCGAGVVVLRLGRAASMGTGAPKHGLRTGTVDCRRGGADFSFCALLRRAHRAYRPLAGDRSLPVLLFPRAERYDCGSLFAWICNALEPSGDAGIFCELVPLVLGLLEITNRDCCGRESSPLGRLSIVYAADQPAIAIAK